ncbi:MAG: dienelactone hydrolase family protein [Gemmatimonadales bacterium]
MRVNGAYGVIVLLGVGVGVASGWIARPGLHGPAREAVTTHGEWVRIGGGAGDSLRAYLAYPERKDLAPAVIVIHEIFGLTDWEPTVVDRLAANGYVAIVPDLLSSRFGVTPADPDSGVKLTAQLVPGQVTADLDAVYRYVNALPAVRRGDIGVIGFCWGGGQSFRYATTNPDLKAAVVCYGPAPDSSALAGIRAPILGVYGENDARIDASLPEVDRRLKGLGKSFSYDRYPGTGHGFLKPGRQGSDGPQVEKAWTRVLSFYRSTLGR